jgi:DNA ligase (NAD+)
MDGVGEKLVDQLLAEGLIDGIAGLYELDEAKLLSLERMGRKSATNVLKEIGKTRSMTFSKFLQALGLPGIGPELATAISHHFQTSQRLFDWIGRTIIDDAEMREITSIDGVGDIVALQLRDGMLLRKDMILYLLTHLTLDKDVHVAEGGSFEGMTFCVTGALSESRKSIQARIKTAGGKVVSSVSGNLSVLVAGENAGSKLAKAQKLAVTVWSEEELLAAISMGEVTDEPMPPVQSTLFDYTSTSNR